METPRHLHSQMFGEATSYAAPATVLAGDVSKRVPNSVVGLIAVLTAIYVLTGYLVHVFQPDWLFSLDPDGLARIGRNLCRTGEFAFLRGQPTVLIPPAYPGALALPCWITGSDPIKFLPLINGLCQLVTLLVLARHPLAQTGKVRVLALLAVGLDPLLLNYSGRAYREPMLILAIALVITAIDRLVREPRPANMLALGLAWGFSLLIKPVLTPLAAATVPVLLLVSRRAAALAFGSFAVALLVIAPWTARNFALTGQVIPVATSGWHGTLAGDTFSRLVMQAEGIEQLQALANDESRKFDEQLGIADLPDYAREPYYQQEELRRIRTDPSHLPIKMLVQSVDFWVLGGDRHKTLVFAILQIPALLLFAIAVPGWLRSNPRALLGLGYVGVYLMSVYAFSLAIARYSMPLRPWIVMVAVSFIAPHAEKAWSVLRAGLGRGAAEDEI